MWGYLGSEDEVIVSPLSIPIGDSILSVNKSHYVLKVEVNRNPRTGVIYVIIPTVIISIVNNFAYIVPMEGGTQGLYSSILVQIKVEHQRIMYKY